MEKSYNIEMEIRGNYLWVLVGGPKLTAEISAAYWNEIAAKCASEKCEKVLIEKNFAETVTPEEMILMADNLSRTLPHVRVAFIDRFRHGAINELGKKLARNRDVMFQVFEDVRSAEKWLGAN
jgi:ethanolamine utilization microcompartment shell protein EutS